MLTRREVVIEQPFRDRRFRDHRRKVYNALPRIDAGPPKEHPHLVMKLKKLRLESDRQGRICEDNLQLLHRLALIMKSKRVDNYNLSNKGPFDNRPEQQRCVKRCSMDRLMDFRPYDTLSFLEEITIEATRRAGPKPKRKIVQHRAPYGYATVPTVGPARYPVFPNRRVRSIVENEIADHQVNGSSKHKRKESHKKISKKAVFLKSISSSSSSESKKKETLSAEQEENSDEQISSILLQQPTQSETEEELDEFYE